MCAYDLWQLTEAHVYTSRRLSVDIYICILSGVAILFK